jgi:nitroimidazol reductase NimA-like FMN-containing flavoprotein (pyridoxamine 5'-phosphate oxidase superfamily)
LVAAGVGRKHRRMPSEMLTKTDAVTVRRKKERADYRRTSANAILDEALVAHVGVCINGQPFVIPMAFGRDGDRLILHGSKASRLLRSLAEGTQVCVTVTIVDSVVLARSQFHTSMDYRSVVVVGTPSAITEPVAKRRAMERLVDHVAPGRTAEARSPTDDELRQITAIEVPIETASVKVRTDGVVDDEQDLALDIWAGVVPVTTQFGAPIPTPDLRDGIRQSPSVSAYRRPGSS